MNELLNRPWDVVVIGTGMGGGTLGRALAEAGKKTLFVEKGPAGHRREETPLSHDIFLPEARLARGLWPAQMRARVDGQEQSFFAPLGAGVGGSSVFYAATLERPAPQDLDHTAARPHPTGGWPVSFAQFEPYLARAEELYQVRGGADVLGPQPSRALPEAGEMGAADRVMAQRLAANGLHPYHLHTAVKNIAGCKSCLGFKCPMPCKMDARSAGVEPALATGHAALLHSAEVRRLVGDGQRITHIELRLEGETHLLRAPVFVLAGGAFGSPRLCLGSASEAFPKGVANTSGRVGRGLMFHLNEMFAVWPGVAGGGPSKAVGFRDLLWHEGARLGMVQAMGMDASYGEILHYLRQRLARSALGQKRLVQEAARLPAALSAKLLGNAKVFVGLMEDLAYEDNRVLPPAGDAIEIEYHMRDELLARRKLFRRAIKSAFKGQRQMFLSNRPELNYGHPCGTLRFGADPKRSVLNGVGRVHELANLYVADASFMPSSMGVNPSLAIAAQALRTAEAIVERGAHD
ncbi:GMC family oxidoreductase [uncultured Lentibacter sp.]|uniref:GMC oxidoreductase n=1 Tax=uncultured Lentibacter sp. TaxID=1659309 RepID=UPI00262F6534|nr:GMC family oxidoreductase [uncultured Lentibacter sp.]